MHIRDVNISINKKFFDEVGRLSAENKKLIEIIKRNQIAWENSSDYSKGFLPEVYLSNKSFLNSLESEGEG